MRDKMLSYILTKVPIEFTGKDGWLGVKVSSGMIFFNKATHLGLHSSIGFKQWNQISDYSIDLIFKRLKAIETGNFRHINVAEKKFLTDCKKLIAKMGLWEYCKAIIQIKNQTEEYNERIYKLTFQELYRIANMVFQEKTLYQDSIETFLENVKNIPGYTIIK